LVTLTADGCLECQVDTGKADVLFTLILTFSRPGRRNACPPRGECYPCARLGPLGLLSLRERIEVRAARESMPGLFNLLRAATKMPVPNIDRKIAGR
jgi:hypothetical protein